MKIFGTLFLRDREFQVNEATVSKIGDLWNLEFGTLTEEYDGERWSPRLYHQGLTLRAVNTAQLPGTSTSWKRTGEASYPHPELGMMYVFGHEPVYDCMVRFGSIEGERIAVEWAGLCDVFWDEQFRDNVPFALRCHAAVSDV